MRTRIYNARLLTLESDRGQNGEVWIKDSVIEYIGEKKQTQEKFHREINADGNLIMPGLKNAHTHLAMTFARSYADDLNLQAWLNDKIFPMEARLTPIHIYYYSKLAMMECITSGITSVCDMYYEPDAIVQAAKDTGMRLVLCGAVNNFKESPEILEEYYKKFNQEHELISYVLGFHAEYTTDFAIIKKIGKLAEKYQAPVFVHNSETEYEVQDCIRRNGVTPTQLFRKAGIYEYGGGGYHCIYLNEDDMEYFRQKGIFAVINTASNLKLASGIPPVKKLLEHNIKLAMGTDGPSSNNALDMFREMYLTVVTQKLLEHDAAAFPAFESLKMAARNGADAMQLKQCDILKQGKKADLIMIDLKQPNMQPINNLVNNIVYSGGKQNVKMTMINGEIVYEDGEFKNIDAEKVYYETNKFLAEIQGE